MSFNVKIKAVEELSRMANHFGRVLFRRYLLPVNIAVSIGCCSCADIFEQKVIESRQTLNIRRVMSMAGCGFLSGVTSTYWYLWTAKFVGRYKVLKQVALSQALFSPYEYVQFYLSVGLLEGQSLANVVAEMRRKFLITYMADCLVFPPLMIINFKLIPLKFRVIYDNCVQLVWCVFLSFLKHHDIDNFTYFLPGNRDVSKPE